MSRQLKWFSAITAVFMLLVVFAGATVTKTGSGEGCGDSWPLCNGEWAPAKNINSLIEYSHRVVSGVVGILITVLTIWAWSRCKERRDAILLVSASFFFTFLQAALGAAAVLWDQNAAVMALHFGFSILAFATIFLFTMIVFQWEKRPWLSQQVSRKFAYSVWGTLIYTYMVVYSGAYVRHTEAIGGCGDSWPLCQGQWLPELSGLTGIQFLHRVAAAVLAIVIFALTIIAWKKYRLRKDVCWAAAISSCLVVAQVLSGGYIFLSGVHLSSTLLHSLLISLLFATLSYLGFQVSKTNARQVIGETSLSQEMSS